VAKSITESPPEFKNSSLFSAGLLVQIVMFNAIYYLPLRKIADFLERSYKINVSFSYINNLLKGIAKVLRPAYLEILDHIKGQKIINIDETVHKMCGKKCCNWIFAGAEYVAFKIGTRSKFNLESVLGLDYEGTIGCDSIFAIFPMPSTMPK
jgi:hypothetical protein